MGVSARAVAQRLEERLARRLDKNSAFFGASTTDQRVIAVEETVICEAPAGEFLAAMATHPRLAARMMTILAKQIFELERTVERTATDPVSQRLADLLVRMAKREGTRVEVRALAEADLARMIGASRESVSRLVASWERDGILRGGQRRIEILDGPPRLAGAAADTGLSVHPPHA